MFVRTREGVWGVVERYCWDRESEVRDVLNILTVHRTILITYSFVVATPWTVDCQVPLSMGFPRQEYWSGSPFPSPEDLPGPGIKPMSLEFAALAGRFIITEPPGKPQTLHK